MEPVAIIQTALLCDQSRGQTRAHTQQRTVTGTVVLSGHSLTRGQMVAAGWEQLVTAVQLAAVTMTGSWVMCRIHVKFRWESYAQHDNSSQGLLLAEINDVQGVAALIGCGEVSIPAQQDVGRLLLDGILLGL